MLKSILRSAYFLIMGPTYRRLQRELTLENQAVKKELLQLEERFTARVMNETVRIVSFLQQQQACNQQYVQDDSEIFHSNEQNLGANQIGNIMQSLRESRDLIKASRDAQISIPELLDLQNRYSGMDGIGVKRVRQLEAENIDLKHTLLDSRLRIEALESELETIKTPGMTDNVRLS